MEKIFLIPVLLCVVLTGCSSGDDSPDVDTSLAEVQLNNISNITLISATASGNVVSQGGSDVTARGFVWGTSSNPDLGDNTLNMGNGPGSFTGNLTNLQTSTEYFVRAFATNSSGTAYSQEQLFTTAQGCDNVAGGMILLRSQQEVNQFGSLGFCEIDGRLEINELISGDPILDLSPLSGIEKVNKLKIIGTEQLQTLNGLNVTTIENELEIAGNESLSNIDALSGLTSDISRVIIANNYQLLNVDGLSGLTDFMMSENEPPYLYIAGNILMSNIDGLQNVQTFDNGIIEINNNFQLSNVDGLASFPNTISSLTIFGNDILSDLSGLSHFMSLPGDLNLEYNNMSDLKDLSNLTSVSGRFRILFSASSNPVSLSGLNNLSEVGGELEIVSGSPMTNVDALESLASVGSLTLYNIHSLVDLNGLSNLTSVLGDLDIRSNDDLTNLCGLTTLITGGGLGGTYIVSGNAYNPTQQDIIDGNCSL